jgi:hypothetical protein
MEVGYPANDKRWEAGLLFTMEDDRETCHPPQEPIEISTDEDTEDPERIYPELTWVPIPMMSRRLVDTLRAAGVGNLQTFETKLINARGKNPPPENFYLAVNVVGLVAAADLGKSEVAPGGAEKMISMDFNSLAIDPARARGASMFRLAENVSAVIVSENVKKHVESAGFASLTWFKPEEWAG